LGTTKGSQTHLIDTDVDIFTPIITFLITANDPDDDTTIIVDTGIRAPDDDGMVMGYPVEGGGPESLREGLADHGVKPDDIDYVVLTHLHFDHADNNELFSDAEFLVQRRELEAARNPLPPQAFAYREAYKSLDGLDTTVIDGGYRLREGIELMFTPGHTRGQQTVIVETEDGPYAIISDLAYCLHNLQPGIETMQDGKGQTIDVTPLDHEYHPPGILVDMVGCYESMTRIRERIGDDGVMVGAHIAEVLNENSPVYH
jgi:glyoxylase-like metal-dependent hydrolase (beta-lactamase superfamily II)